MKKISELIEFFKVDIWRISLDEFSNSRSFLIRQLRIIVLTLRCFIEDKCQLRASALTFYVLLSIVPITAMAFGFAKGFNQDNRLKKHLLNSVGGGPGEMVVLSGTDVKKNVDNDSVKSVEDTDLIGKTENASSTSGQREVIVKVIDFAEKMLDETKEGMVAGVGVLILFWTVMKVLGNIELAFNDIWGVKESRPFMQKCKDYTFLVFIGVLCLVISGSINVLAIGFFKSMVAKYEFVAMFDGIILLGLRLIPTLFISAGFCFVYRLIPNTNVRFKPALIGGVVAGVLYQLLQVLYFSSQASLSTYGAIYGSFAALPLFLIWLQFSWYVVLFGAEVAFANQNVDTFIYESETSNISVELKNEIALVVMRQIVCQFKVGKEAMDEDQLAHELDIPIRLTRKVLEELHDAGLVTATAREDKSVCYQPSRTIEQFSIFSVMSALNTCGSTVIPYKETDASKQIKESLTSLRQGIKDSAANVTLKDV